jgi:hypothetical protein
MKIKKQTKIKNSSLKNFANHKQKMEIHEKKKQLKIIREEKKETQQYI